MHKTLPTYASPTLRPDGENYYDDADLFDFRVHPNVFSYKSKDDDHRHAISTDKIAPLLTFDRSRIKPDVVAVDYLIVSPFEYFPVLVLYCADGTREYLTYGSSAGWESIVHPNALRLFAGTDKPMPTLVELVDDVLADVPPEYDRS